MFEKKIVWLMVFSLVSTRFFSSSPDFHGQPVAPLAPFSPIEARRLLFQTDKSERRFLRCTEAAGVLKGHSSTVINSFIKGCPVGFIVTGSGPFVFRGNELHGGTDGLRLSWI